MVPAEPADLPLDPTLLVGALDAGQAVGRVDAVVRPERGPPLVLRAGARAEYPGDRGAEVVVTDLAGGHSAQHAESVDVAFEERLLAAGGEDAVHGLARIRQAHREHEAGDQLTGQTYLHVAEVHLRLGPRPVGLRNERVYHPAASLNSDLGATVGDIGPHHRIGHRLRPVLVQEPVEDPLDRVTLLARRIQIRPEHLVDQRLVGIQAGPARPRLLPRLRPDRLQRGLHRAESDSVLTHQGPVRHPYPGITADRRVQVDLGFRWRHRSLIPQGTSMLPPQPLKRCQNSQTSPSGETRRSRP